MLMQSKFISDEANRQNHGLEYALKQIAEDCTCKVCRTKYRNSKDAQECCGEE